MWIYAKNKGMFLMCQITSTCNLIRKTRLFSNLKI